MKIDIEQSKRIYQKLTKRELDILELISQGKSFNQMAYELNIQTGTIKNLMRNARNRTGCETSTEIVHHMSVYLTSRIK